MRSRSIQETHIYLFIYLFIYHSPLHGSNKEEKIRNIYKEKYKADSKRARPHINS